MSIRRTAWENLKEGYIPLYTDLRTRVKGEDLVILFFIPILLILIFLLPDAVERALVLEYSSPSFLTLFTTHFVHIGFDHLASNLAGYFMVVALLYPMSVLAGERRWFLQSFFVFLFILPFIVSGVNASVLSFETSRGFSDINSAFLGMMPVSIFAFIRERSGKDIRMTNALSLLMVSMAILAIKYGGTGTPYLIFTFLGVAIAAIYLKRTADDLGLDWRGAVKELASWPGYSELLAVAVITYFLLQFSLFPVDFITEQGAANIPAHYFGFGIGFFVPYLLFLFGRGNRI